MSWESTIGPNNVFSRGMKTFRVKEVEGNGDGKVAGNCNEMMCVTVQEIVGNCNVVLKINLTKTSSTVTLCKFQTCKITSVCLHLFLKARLTRGSSVSCCRLSVVVLWSLLWATHGLPPQRHWCTVGVLAGTHQCAAESRMTLWQSANPSLWLLES